MIPISSNLGGWHRSQENLIKPRVPALSEVEGSLAFGDRGDYLLRPAPIPDFADHSLNKAQTLYRPNTNYRKAKHEKNPHIARHRTTAASTENNPQTGKSHFSKHEFISVSQ
jgi:hypothetical protein